MADVVRVAFVTLGCKVNQAEAEEMASVVMGAGARLVTQEDADVVVITTCTVTGEADSKGRKAVRRALALPGAPQVLVTGCMASVSKEALVALGSRVVVESDKDRVPARVMEVAGVRDTVNPERAIVCVGEEPGGIVHGLRVAGGTGSNIPFTRKRTRVQIKVEDGCDAFCAYCIIPYARGVPRSVPLDNVIRQVNRCVAEGVHEVVLTGINIGKYAWRGVGLPDLIEAVAETGVSRIRLSSIEPNDVTGSLLRVAAATPAFCRHLHVPLQSGSDGVLARMGRPYSTGHYSAVLTAAHEALPGVAVTTDVIAGFPGETDDEWTETLAFVEDAGFTRLHVFRYSRRSGTRAAVMPDHLPPQVIGARAASLRECGERLARRHAKSLVGTTAEIVVECVRNDSRGMQIAEGVTRDYSRVGVSGNVRDSGCAPGDLVTVCFESMDEHGRLTGRIVG